MVDETKRYFLDTEVTLILKAENSILNDADGAIEFLNIIQLVGLSGEMSAHSCICKN